MGTEKAKHHAPPIPVDDSTIWADRYVFAVFIHAGAMLALAEWVRSGAWMPFNLLHVLQFVDGYTLWLHFLFFCSALIAVQMCKHKISAIIAALLGGVLFVYFLAGLGFTVNDLHVQYSQSLENTTYRITSAQCTAYDEMCYQYAIYLCKGPGGAFCRRVAGYYKDEPHEVDGLIIEPDATYRVHTPNGLLHELP